MNENYKDQSIEEIAEEYSKGGVSLEDLAEIYEFPSVDILINVLQEYYKEHGKGRLKLTTTFTQDQKEYIRYLFKNKKYSIRKIAQMASTTEYTIKKILKEFENIEELRDNIQQEKQDTDHNESDSKKSTRKFYHKIDNIPIDEITNAFINNDVESIIKKYGVSRSHIRDCLVRAYGENYVQVLRGDKKDKILHEFAMLYEDGYSYEEIANMKETSISDVDYKLGKYYKKKNIRRPKILSEKKFMEYMEKEQEEDMDKVIEHFNEINFRIPERYIQKYLKKTGKVDLRLIKTLFFDKLSKLQDDEQKQQCINDIFYTSKQLQEKGLGTEYKVVALLHSLMQKTDMQLDEVLDLLKYNSEMSEAIQILNSNNLGEEFSENDIANKIKEIIEENRRNNNMETPEGPSFDD